MTMDEIFKTMQDLIAEQFAIDTDEIGMDSSFVDDLGADSVDMFAESAFSFLKVTNSLT